MCSRNDRLRKGAERISGVGCMGISVVPYMAMIYTIPQIVIPRHDMGNCLGPCGSCTKSLDIMPHGEFANGDLREVTVDARARWRL